MLAATRRGWTCSPTTVCWTAWGTRVAGRAELARFLEARSTVVETRHLCTNMRVTIVSENEATGFCCALFLQGTAAESGTHRPPCQACPAWWTTTTDTGAPRKAGASRSGVSAWLSPRQRRHLLRYRDRPAQLRRRPRPLPLPERHDGPGLAGPVRTSLEGRHTGHGATPEQVAGTARRRNRLPRCMAVFSSRRALRRMPLPPRGGRWWGPDAGGDASVGLGAGGLDDVGPVRRLLPNAARELLRRGGHGLRGLLRHQGLHVRRGHDLADL
jgi:hypothetical protein